MPEPPRRPSDLKPRVVGCSLPREIYDRLEQVATARQISISAVMREGLIKAYAPARPDEP